MTARYVERDDDGSFVLEADTRRATVFPATHHLGPPWYANFYTCTTGNRDDGWLVVGTMQGAYDTCADLARYWCGD